MSNRNNQWRKSRKDSFATHRRLNRSQQHAETVSNESFIDRFCDSRNMRSRIERERQVAEQQELERNRLIEEQSENALIQDSRVLEQINEIVESMCVMGYRIEYIEEGSSTRLILPDGEIIGCRNRKQAKNRLKLLYRACKSWSCI